MHLLLSGAALVTLFNNVQVQAAATGSPAPGLAQSPAMVALNSSLAGRLSVGTPWAKPCYSQFNGFAQTADAQQCAFVQENYFNSHSESYDMPHDYENVY